MEEEISYPPTYRYERGSRDTYVWQKQKATGVGPQHSHSHTRTHACAHSHTHSHTHGHTHILTHTHSQSHTQRSPSSSHTKQLVIGVMNRVCVCVSLSHLHACPLSGPQMRTNVPSWCDRILWKSYPETHIVCNSYGETPALLDVIQHAPCCVEM